jgi:hypothetical protein
MDTQDTHNPNKQGYWAFFVKGYGVNPFGAGYFNGLCGIDTFNNIVGSAPYWEVIFI